MATPPKVVTVAVGIDCSTTPNRLLVKRWGASSDELTDPELTDPELTAAWADVFRNVVEPVKAWCDLRPVTRAIAEAARQEIVESLARGLWPWRDRVSVSTLLSVDEA
jgi:hypothetical protein